MNLYISIEHNVPFNFLSHSPNLASSSILLVVLSCKRTWKGPNEIVIQVALQADTSLFLSLYTYKKYDCNGTVY